MSLYRRGRTYWYKFQWRVKVEGRSYRIQASTRTSNKKKAKDVEDEHRRALRLGEVHPKDPWPRVEPKREPLTLRQLWPRFIEYIRLRKKPSTARFYSISAERILRFTPIAEVPMASITSELVGKFAQWRQAQQIAKSLASINADLRTLRRIFSVAVEWGELTSAPATHELEGAVGRDFIASFAFEATYLRSAASTVRDLAMLAVDSGLRPNSELFPLEWCNVHLESTPDAPQGFMHVREGKTKNAVRNVPLTPRTREMLLARRELMVGPKDAKRRCGDLRFVFPGAGREGHIMTVQHAHETAMRKAGLKRMDYFEFYCWRHTFATRCAESGMDKFSLARLMGHSSPSVAERYYVKVTTPHVMAGFEKFIAYQTMKMIEAFPARTATKQ